MGVCSVIDSSFSQTSKATESFNQITVLDDSKFISQIKKCYIYSWKSADSPLDNVGNIMTLC